MKLWFFWFFLKQPCPPFLLTPYLPTPKHFFSFHIFPLLFGKASCFPHFSLLYYVTFGFTISQRQKQCGKIGAVVWPIASCNATSWPMNAFKQLTFNVGYTIVQKKKLFILGKKYDFSFSLKNNTGWNKKT